MTQTVAYRDDLEAAQLRLHDLEREHAALQARNAELEPQAPGKPKGDTPAVHRRLFASKQSRLVIGLALLIAPGLVVYACTEPYGWLRVLAYGSAFAVGRALDARKLRVKELGDGRQSQ